MRLILLAIFLFSIQRVAFADSSYISVKWENPLKMRKKFSKCGISFKKPYRIPVSKFKTCQGLTETHVYGAQYKTKVRELFNKINSSFSNTHFLETRRKQKKLVHIERALERIEAVEVHYFPWGVLNSEELRGSAAYLVDLGLVVLNDKNEKSKIVKKYLFGKVAPSPFFIHEFLGALGFYDRHYEVSTILYWANYIREVTSSSGNVFMKELSFLNKKIMQEGWIKLAGGCTLVCGGGDFGEAMIKSFLLRYLKDYMMKDLSHDEYYRMQKKVIHSHIKKMDEKKCSDYFSCFNFLEGPDDYDTDVLTIFGDWYKVWVFSSMNGNVMSKFLLNILDPMQVAVRGKW